MSIQWVYPRDDSKWIAKSSDGYYAVSWSIGNYICRSANGAYHIEAVWATPKLIGEAASMVQAQHICEQHRAGTPA
jgi:hypothetical protein